MNKLKKLSIALIALAILLSVLMSAHVVYRYYQILESPLTSAPASVAFFLIIPYALAIIPILIAAFILLKKSKSA